MTADAVSRACCAAFLISALLLPQAVAGDELRVNADRLGRDLEELSRFGAREDGGIDRVAFSQADVDARAWLKERLRAAGLTVRVDAAGNLLGRRDGREDLPVILFGSHIDSVPAAGRFDGNAGVVAALECVRVLDEHGIRTRHPLEVVVFTDEEGSMVGSRAMAGLVTPES